MKRFFALIVSFLILFLIVAPVFSFAVAAPYTFISSIPKNQLYYNTVVFNKIDTDTAGTIGFQYDFNATCSFTVTNYSNVATPIVTVTFSNYSPNRRIEIYAQYTNLITGDIVYDTRAGTSDANGTFTFALTSSILPTLSCYYYVEQNIDSFVNGTSTLLTKVDPFVTFPIRTTSDIIYSAIPEPIADSKHIYFADYQFLYEIIIPSIEMSYFSFSSLNSYTSGTEDNGYFIFYNFTNNNDNLHFLISKSGSNDETSYDAYCYKYILKTGEFVSVDSFNNNNSNFININIPLSYNAWERGFWSSPYITSLSANEYDYLNIVWADTTVIHNDFTVVNSLLDNIISNQLRLHNDIINTQAFIRTINNNISSILSTLIAYKEWVSDKLFGYDPNTGTFNDEGLITSYINFVSGTLSLLYWNIHNNLIPSVENIEDYLINHTEPRPDTSDFDNSISEYEEGESFVVNQAEVALDNLESQMSGAQNVLTVNSRGLLFIKNIFETFAFSGMNYYYMLFVLVIGSVALLIGKRLR